MRYYQKIYKVALGKNPLLLHFSIIYFLILGKKNKNQAALFANC